MDIFHKICAVVTAGTLIFSDIAFNAQYVSAENEIFPETLTITESNYTGRLINSYNIDIDNDGEKEKIGHYYIENIQSDPFDVYYICDDNSEPYEMYKQKWNDHVHPSIHIVQDNNTGETFIGYTCYDVSASESLHKLYPDGQDQLIIGFNGVEYQSGEMAEYEKYLEYMQNVTFLDQTAYGKGDVDGDADITLSDAGIMLSCYADNAAGLAAEINEIQKNAADMDKDGEITISDASTALSLYAEHAAGIIDTPIIPSFVHFDSVKNYDGYYSLTTGDLESVFYLDIDNDGAKESIGRYINTNLENTFAMHCAPYVYQVYDNGRFVDTYGLDTNICRTQYVLISDHNINETYLAHLTEGGIASSFHFAVINKVDPKLSTVMEYYFYEEGNEEFRTGNDRIDVDRTDFLEYISNLEIIDPNGKVDEDLYLFKFHGFLT